MKKLLLDDASDEKKLLQDLEFLLVLEQWEALRRIEELFIHCGVEALSNGLLDAEPIAKKLREELHLLLGRGQSETVHCIVEVFDKLVRNPSGKREPIKRGRAKNRGHNPV